MSFFSAVAPAQSACAIFGADAAPRDGGRRRKTSGKALSVTDVRLYSEGMNAPVARATLTYSIPPAR